MRGWDFDAEPLTPEERAKLYYLSLAGPYPGPCRSAVAAVLAWHMVELEDA